MRIPRCTHAKALLAERLGGNELTTSAGNFQATFREQSVNIQCAFREHSGNIHGTFREQSGYIQGTFREHSLNIGNI
jgi:hypothetical protein